VPESLVSSDVAGSSSDNPVPDELVSRWAGAYDPLGRADTLVIQHSNFSWGKDCKEQAFRAISVSQAEFAFEVSPKSECGWAGMIVALTTDARAPRAIHVNVYRALSDYQAKRSIAFFAYSKRF
jgi:hypothetical protein